MSKKTNDWVWDQEIKPASLKLTLLAFADRTNDDYECWPSYARLIKDTGLNYKTIAKNIRILVKLGLLKDTGRRKGMTMQTKVYRFTFTKAP